MLRPCSPLVIVTALAMQAIAAPVTAAQPRAVLKALIVDGQNNFHPNWPQTTKMMAKYLQDTGRFTVDVVTHAPKGADPAFAPAFKDYAVVVSNIGNGATPWKAETKAAFEEYVQAGGGFVAVHAANNAFPDWDAYNRMTGLGGWGGRSEKHGPSVYYSDDGKLVRDTTPGPGGSHGPLQKFVVQVRAADHAITKGMPAAWMHADDELYDTLRGPAENMEILATAYSEKSKRHEPMIMTIHYGRGRVFHTPMGHANGSQECVGFITTLQRGCEWAATGEVSVPVPADFPTASEPRRRPFPAPPAEPASQAPAR